MTMVLIDRGQQNLRKMYAHGLFSNAVVHVSLFPVWFGDYNKYCLSGLAKGDEGVF